MTDCVTFIDGDIKTKEVSMLSLTQERHRKKQTTIVHDFFPQNEPWPRKTDIACFYDSHKFDTMPIPMVIMHDALHDRVITSGIFCSGECIRQYQSEKRGFSFNTYTLHQSIFMKSQFGIGYDGVSCADSKFTLKFFGGKKTIEEFRANFKLPQVERLVDPLFMYTPLVFATIIPDKKPGITTTDLLVKEVKDKYERMNKEEDEAQIQAINDKEEKKDIATPISLASNNVPILEQLLREIEMNAGSTLEEIKKDVLKKVTERSSLSSVDATKTNKHRKLNK